MSIYGLQKKKKSISRSIKIEESKKNPSEFNIKQLLTARRNISKQIKDIRNKKPKKIYDNLKGFKK